MKAVLYKERKLARVVYMSVSKKHKVDIGGGDGKLAVFIHIGTLLHTAVHKKLFSRNLNKRAGACNFVRRAYKCDFQRFSPSFQYYDIINFAVLQYKIKKSSIDIAP